MLRFPRTSTYRPLSPAEHPQRIEDLRFQRPDCLEKLKGISRVAVVGGGFGGLMAALELIKYGIKVTVFEAHDTVGGRVRSNKTFVEGRITEFGAELIGSFHTKWLGLARKYGLAMISRMEPEHYQQAGLDVKLTLDKPLSMDEFFKLTKEMNDKVLLPFSILAKLIKDPSRPWKQKWLKTDWLMTKLDNMSVAAALEKILKIKRNGPLWKLIEFKLVNDEVDTLDEMNFLGLLCKVRGGQGERFGEGLKPILMGYWDELEIFRCADGCQQLARDMATEINNTPGCKVELNKMVDVIDILDDKVKLNWVRVENKKPVPGAGQSEDCEFVILAIPPSVWDDVTIRVGGEKVKLKDKIGPIGMAPAVKFFSEVKKRFWINDKDKAAPYGGSSAIGQVWEGTDNQTRLEGRRGNDEIHRIVLSVFAGPIRPGREAPTPDDFIKGLELLYPGYKSNLTKPPRVHFANWPKEPFIMTGYVSPAKGQILTIGPKLTKPFHHRLFFAGEHTQMDHFGYMEGALRSGERAAHTLMLKKCGLLKEPAPKSPSRPPQKPAPAPKSPSPPLVARGTPTREIIAFEHESPTPLQEHWSTDYPAEAESPFFDRSLFAAEAEDDWEPRAAAVVAESPFVGALEERQSSFDEDQLTAEAAPYEFEGDDESDAEEPWEQSEGEQGTVSSVVAPFPGRIVMALEMVSLKDDTFGACIEAASEPPDVRGMCGAVIDLTGDPDLPPYRGHNDIDMVYVGSLAKIYPLLAAFELRRRVTWQAKDMIKIGLSTTTADWQKKVFAELKKGWQPRLNAAFKGRGLPLNKFPNLAEVVELSPDGTAQLREEFLGWITAALRRNDEAAAGRYIRALSYPYINGVLAAAGFFDPAKKTGLWISGDFNGNDWLPKDAAGAPLTSRWRLPGHAVSNFTGTALQVARFLGLMAQGKLVDSASSSKMIELLGVPFLKKTLEDATPPRSFTSVKGKVGIGTWDTRFHDGAIVTIESDPARTPIKYALVTLGSPRNAIAALRKLELAYHDCVVARHP